MSLGKKKGGKGGAGGDDSDSDDDAVILDEHGNKLPTKSEIKKYKAMKEGKRNADSESEYRYGSR